MGKIEKMIDNILDAHSVILSKYINKETGAIEDFGAFAKAIDRLKLEKEQEILDLIEECIPRCLDCPYGELGKMKKMNIELKGNNALIFCKSCDIVRKDIQQNLKAL